MPSLGRLSKLPHWTCILDGVFVQSACNQTPNCKWRSFCQLARHLQNRKGQDVLTSCIVKDGVHAKHFLLEFACYAL